MRDKKTKKICVISILALSFLVFGAKTIGLFASSVNVTATVDSSSFPQPIISINASPTSITLGQSSTISWTASQHADSISFSPPTLGCNPTIGVAGSCEIIPLQTTTYTVSAVNTSSGMSTSSSVVVTVYSPPSSPIAPPQPEIPPASPTVSLKANDSKTPDQIPFDGSVKLTWSSTNAQNCNASGGWSGSKNVQGEEIISGIQEDKVFTISCFNNNLVTSDSVSISVEKIEQLKEKEPEEKITPVTPPETSQTPGETTTPVTPLEEIQQPITFEIITDKNEAVADGKDKISIKVISLDQNGKPIKGIEIEIISNSEDSFLTTKNTTDANGAAYFTITSQTPHTSEIQVAPKDSENFKYDSEKKDITFTEKTPVTPTEKEPTEIYKIIGDTFNQQFDQAINNLLNVKNNPEIKSIVQDTLVPTVAIGAAAIAYISIASLVKSLSDIIPLLNYLINVILQAFGIKRKPKQHWGTAYDSKTKIPLDLAIVRLIDAKTKSVIETTVTDKMGRFSFAPRPGQYTIEVSKGSFNFPSNNLKNLTTDGIYSKLYFGGNIKIKNESDLTNFSIPLDQPNTTPGKIGLMDIVNSLLDKASTPALFTGIVLSLFSLWVSPTATNIVITTLYGGLLTFKKILLAPPPKPMGKIINLSTGAPVKDVDVKIFDGKYNKLLDTKRTDEKGRFFMMLPKGNYYLRIASYNYNLAPKKGFYNGDTFEVNNESKPLKLNIALKNI